MAVFAIFGGDPIVPTFSISKLYCNEAKPAYFRNVKYIWLHVLVFKRK